MRYREIDKKLRKNGWVIISQTGSHIKYRKIDNSVQTIILPNHGTNDLSIGVVKCIEKASGLSFR